MCAERMEETIEYGVSDQEVEEMSNAAKLVTKVSTLVARHSNLKTLFDEMLHSILFLGYCINFRATPESILGEDMCQLLRDSGYARALTEYHIRLPQRSPFSCLLDMIVTLKGKVDADRVRVELRNFISTLNLKGEEETLIGSTICFTSDLNSKEVLTYGVSLSQTCRSNKEIIIAVSCLHTWHPLVSYAVMCQTQKVAIVEDYRIHLQTINARCTAYNVKDPDIDLEPKPPCKFCKEMFSLEGKVQKSGSNHLPGNCAEPEAISKLLEIRDINFDHDHGFRMQFDQLKHQTNDKLGSLNEGLVFPISIYKPNIQPSTVAVQSGIQIP